ncbi:MAG TPA: pyridoxamine 5'-phosphate oxidase family protein, partial [Nocardioidaceae bacterium]|nr:pyridoxamine 5'-phosphate oxidase family protein [Nocardioidaceae bacterium]
MTRTTPVRMPEKMSGSRADLDALLDATVLAHIAFVAEDGTPAVLPTMVARWDDRVLIHGSTASRWMRRVAEGVPVAVSVAVIDGIVVARSAFESSLLYTSGVLFGSFAPLAAEEKAAALEVVTERLLPGRTTEIRASTAKEL